MRGGQSLWHGLHVSSLSLRTPFSGSFGRMSGPYCPLEVRICFLLSIILSDAV